MTTSCLISSITDQKAANFVFCWTLYRVRDDIFVHSHHGCRGRESGVEVHHAERRCIDHGEGRKIVVELAESVRNVRTREDLVAFLRHAAEDVTANPEGWENISLPAFLEAWAAWLNDCPGWFANNGQEVPASPSWKFVGDMVMAARVYE